MSPQKFLVTGSSGHLGEAMVRTLRAAGHDVVGLDIASAPTTTTVGSIGDRALIEAVMAGVDVVVHAAALHKPHIGTHRRADFIDVNVAGTTVLAEAAAAAGVASFVMVSTTSTFGRALYPRPDEPATWCTEDTIPVPRNIYGVTKIAAEDICRLVHDQSGLPVVVLRTARFFPEADDRDEVRHAFDDANVKVCELRYRRVDIADVVEAVCCAVRRAPDLGFARYIISAATPFRRSDVTRLRSDAASVLAERAPEYVEVYVRDEGGRC